MKRKDSTAVKTFVVRMALGAFVALTAAGCGNSSGGGDAIELAKLNGVEYGLLDKAGLTVTPASVTGTGSIIIREPRPADDSNYALAFALQPGGSVKLVTNSDRKLATGVTLTFTRPATGTLKVVLAIGSEKFDISGDFDSIAVDQPIVLDADVHAHGHAIVWAGGAENEYAFTTRVAGKLWGLTLDKATVTDARATKAKEQHGH